MSTMAGRLLILHLSRLIAAIAVVIVSLYSVLALLEDLGGIEQGGFGVLLRDLSLKLPEIIYLVLPATCAIGAAVGVALLDSRGELTLMRLMGISARRIVAWMAAAASVWVLLHAAVGEFLLTASAEAERRIESQRSGSLASGDGVWLRTPSGFASVGLIAKDGELLHDIWIFDAPGDEGLTRVAHARRGLRQQGTWLLEGLRVATDAPEGWGFTSRDREVWDDGPTPELIDALSIKPRYLPLARLLEVSRELGSLGQSTLAYDLVIWSRVADSLAIIALVAAGLLFASGRGTRRASPRVAGVAALLAMFVYSYAGQLIREATLDFAWPAALGALLPLALFTALALGLARLLALSK